MLLFVVAVPALLAALRASAAPQFVDPGFDSSTAPFLAAQEAEFQAEQAAQGNGPKARQLSDESAAAEAAAEATAEVAEAAAAAEANNQLNQAAAAAAVAKSEQDQAAAAIGRSYSSLVDLD